MARNTATSVAASDCEVMASVDGEQFIIAELCRDDAWLSVSTDAAIAVDEFQ